MLGITLLELLIVIAVVGILLAVAAPSFLDYIERSRRSDAMIALQRVANEQEQFYFDNNRYSLNFTSINLTNLSPDGYYTLSLPTANTTLFIARTVPVAGTPSRSPVTGQKFVTTNAPSDPTIRVAQFVTAPHSPVTATQ